MFFAIAERGSRERVSRARARLHRQTAATLRFGARDLAGAGEMLHMRDFIMPPIGPHGGQLATPGRTKTAAKGLQLACFHSRHVEQPLDDLRLLCPGDGVAPGDDEAGHAVDA